MIWPCLAPRGRIGDRAQILLDDDVRGSQGAAAPTRKPEAVDANHSLARPKKIRVHASPSIRR